VGLKEPFTSPTGARLMYPGDTSLGAGPAETIQCRCTVSVRIDFLANIGAAPKPVLPGLPIPAAAPSLTRAVPVEAAPAQPAAPAASAQSKPGGYRDARLPKDAAEAKEYIRAAGIALNADLSGMSVRNIATSLNAAHEVVERFGLEPLDFMGPISRSGAPFRVKTPKNANAALFAGKVRDGSTYSAFHMPTKFGDLKDAQRSAALGEAGSAKYTDQRDRAFADRKKMPGWAEPDAEAAMNSVEPGRYGWSISSLSGDRARAVTTYHEFGHVLHLVDRRIGPEINSFLREHMPRKRGWQYAISQYSGANDMEYIAEAFAIYMSRPLAEHRRIHPALLAIFRKYDGEYVPR
jgi:hypothetical protein